MLPLLRLVYLDETEYWQEDIVKFAGRIAGVYLYNAHLQTFCCEITPSYEMHLVGYLTEHTVNDDIQMKMQEATDTGQVSYIHSRQVDHYQRIRRRTGYHDIDPFVIGRMPCSISLPGPWTRNHESAMAEALEMLSQNGYTTT